LERQRIVGTFSRWQQRSRREDCIEPVQDRYWRTDIQTWDGYSTTRLTPTTPLDHVTNAKIRRQYLPRGTKWQRCSSTCLGAARDHNPLHWRWEKASTDHHRRTAAEEVDAARACGGQPLQHRRAPGRNWRKLRWQHPHAASPSVGGPLRHYWYRSQQNPYPEARPAMARAPELVTTARFGRIAY